MTAREFDLDPSGALARDEAGETIDILRDARPIARVVPATQRDDLLPNEDTSLGPRPKRGTPEWQAAHDHMVAMMREGMPLGIDRVTYEDKHE